MNKCRSLVGSGVIKTSKELDYEIEQNYDFIVVAKDGGFVSEPTTLRETVPMLRSYPAIISFDVPTH